MAIFDRNKLRKFSKLSTDTQFLNIVQDEIKRVLDNVIDYIRGEDWRVVGDPGEPEFLNDWSSSATSTFEQIRFKRVGNSVHISGLGTPGTVANDDTGTVFILPVGYRPPDRHRLFVGISSTGGTRALSLFDVLTNGRVRARLGGSTWYSFECIFDL